MWKSLVLSALLLLLPSLQGRDSARDAKRQARYPRRLASLGQRFINQFEFKAWYWPPKRKDGTDYKYDRAGDAVWFEDYQEAIEQYTVMRAKVDQIEQAVNEEEAKAKVRLYRHPTRAYPLCVDGFKPLLHELEDPEVWAESQHDMANPKYNYVYDEFYHWIPIFKLMAPRNGVYQQGWNINAMGPDPSGGKAYHVAFDGKGMGPYLIHCRREYLETRQTTHQTEEPRFTGALFQAGRSEEFRYLPHWFHIHCQAPGQINMEGVLIQAVSYPNGLPFGKFVDDRDCFTSEIHEVNDLHHQQTHFADMHCHTDPKSFTWIEGTPEEIKTKRLRSVMPCKYNHGNNNGGYYPTVWITGGNRWTVQIPKYVTFRSLFTYTSAHCNNPSRFNFIILTVRSFINAAFDVYVSASFPLPFHDQSLTTPHLTEDWHTVNGLKCDKKIENEGFEGSNNVGPSIFHELDHAVNRKWDWEKEHGTFEAAVKIGSKPYTAWFLYDRDYDDCIRDTTNSLGLLDPQRNCPPNNLCLNLEHQHQHWDKDERVEDIPDYYNPVSIHRFDKFWMRQNQHTPALQKLVNHNCHLKRCIHPKYTIPIVKMRESHDDPNKHCAQQTFGLWKSRLDAPKRIPPFRRQFVPDSQSQNERQGQAIDDDDLINRTVIDLFEGEGEPVGPHRFAEELTRGMFIQYNAYVKQSIITHAWMMVFAWFVLLTTGIFTSRYYKETGGTDSDGGNAMMGIGAWIWVHVLLLLLSMMFMWMGVLEVAHLRQRPNSCNMFETFQDMSLKNYCRWRKQSVRYHQALGYVSLVLFHVSFFLAWSRPVKVWNLGKISINWRKIFVYVHVFSGYGGKFFAVASVMAFWDPRAFSVCKDIPILIIVIEFVSILFFVIGWIVQFLEDRRRPHDEDSKWMKKCWPVLEAVSAENVPWYGCKVALVISSVVVHLALFLIVCVSLDMVFGRDGEGADKQGEFEIRKGLFGTCNVTSRDSIMKGMVNRYYQELPES